MATLYISEFGNQATIGVSLVPIASLPPVAQQTVAIGGASAASAAFNAKTHLIRLAADSVCSVLVGDAPTALATSMRLSAGLPEYFGVVPGQKVAVISNT